MTERRGMENEIRSTAHDKAVEEEAGRLVRLGVDLNGATDYAMRYMASCITAVKRDPTVEFLFVDYRYAVERAGVRFEGNRNKQYPDSYFDFYQNRLPDLKTPEKQEAFAQVLTKNIAERMKKDYAALSYQVDYTHNKAFVALTIRILNPDFKPVARW